MLNCEDVTLLWCQCRSLAVSVICSRPVLFSTASVDDSSLAGLIGIRSSDPSLTVLFWLGKIFEIFSNCSKYFSFPSAWKRSMVTRRQEKTWVYRRRVYSCHLLWNELPSSNSWGEEKEEGFRRRITRKVTKNLPNRVSCWVYDNTNPYLGVWYIFDKLIHTSSFWILPTSLLRDNKLSILLEVS